MTEKTSSLTPYGSLAQHFAKIQQSNIGTSNS